MVPQALPSTADPKALAHATRVGALYAIAAYGAWGIVPVYWKAVRQVPAAQMVAHRSAWSLLVVVVLLRRAGRLGEAVRVLRDRRQCALLFASAVLLASNWFIFLWAVNHGLMLESSLGYYVNPLVNVLLGVWILRERLRPMQGVAVLLAVVAVTALAILTGTPPTIALGLACTFGTYGLLRKRARVDALVGLSIETALMFPFAVAFLVVEALTGRGAFLRSGWTIDALILASGPISAFTLLWFAEAARRLRYSTLGQFQYLTPTGHFLLAIFVYGEHLSTGHVIAFSLIATALTLYAIDSARASRSALPTPPD